MGKRYGLRMGQAYSRGYEEPKWWPRITGSHIGKERKRVCVVIMETRTSKEILVPQPSVWRHGRICGDRGWLLRLIEGRQRRKII